MILMIEVKDSVLTGNALVHALERNGISKANVIVMTFVDAYVASAKADGYTLLKLYNTAGTATANFANDRAFGYSVVSCEAAGWTAERVASAQAQGLKTVAWTVNRRSEADALIALGIDVITTDDGSYLRDRTPLTEMPWTGARWAPGMVPSNSSSAGVRGCDGVAGYMAPTFPRRQSALHHPGGRVPASVSLYGGI